MTNMANLLLTLIFLNYLIIILFNIFHPSNKAYYDWVLFYAITFSYVFISLILTIMVAHRGSFDWISNIALWRNIGVGVLWIGMVAGIYICMSMKAGIGMGNKSTGFARMIALMIYNGGLWLPPLMIISYFSLFHADSRFALSPYLYKTFLLLCSTVGLLTLVAFKPVKRLISDNSEEYNYNLAIYEIDKAKTLEEKFELLPKIKDNRQLTVLLKRIKDQPNFEDELINVLMNSNQFTSSPMYDYILKNPIEHTDLLIEPINSSLTTLNSQFEGVGKASWETGADAFDHIDMQLIFQVMYKYFGANREPFRIKVLLIKQTLETFNERNVGNEHAPEFMKTLNKYKLEIQNWLDGE